MKLFRFGDVNELVLFFCFEDENLLIEVEYFSLEFDRVGLHFDGVSQQIKGSEFISLWFTVHLI